MPEFPPEIVSNILAQLQAKSLLRFRCASKPYRNLIDGPDFIKLHLDRSVQNRSRRSLILRDCYLYSVELDSLDRAVELDHPLKSDQFGTEVLGSCNGLLCLSNSLEMDGEDTVIWNMSTREHRKVPATRIEFPEVDYFTGCQYIVYGLGYDSISDDHKLVRIIQFYGEDFDSFENEVKVYSVKSNSWRRIGDFPYYLRYKRTWGQFAGGALHWVVSRRAESDTENLIGAVDLGAERYRLVPKPKGLVGEFHMNLGVFEGCLCMICNYYQVRVDVWVMKDYGVRESWTKLMSIGQPKVIRSFEFLVPLVRSGDRVLLNQDGDKLLWYDLGTKKVRKVKVRGFPDSMCDMEIYQDSLVRLGGGDRIAEVNQAARRRKKKNMKKKNAKKRDNVESEWNKMVQNNSGEVVTDILSRLPVKTLLRLKCVCKPWCTLIDDSNFIKRHLKTSMESSTNLSLILADSYCIYSVDLNSFDKAVELDHPCKYLSCGTEVLGGVEVLGSCNGLLCLYTPDKEILLCNPSTRKHQDIPITPMMSPDGFTLDRFINYGFGYDSTADDYKVVRIAQFLGEVKDSFVNEVKVYSLKTNSWRKIQDFSYYVCYKREWGVFAGGALHWVVTRRPDSGTSASIVAFDLGTEQCREVPMPNNLDKAVLMYLTVFGGNLCILCNYLTVRIDIWVMKDYGAKESWTRLCSLTRPRALKSLEYVKPLIYSNSGNEVLLECDSQKLFWYDLIGKTVKKVKIPNMPHSFCGVVHVGSLVPLGGHDRSVGKQKEAASKKVKKRDDFLSSGFKLVL